MHRERVSLLFGGVSSEHDVSLETFAHVYEVLRTGRDKLELIQVLYVDPEGQVQVSPAQLDEPAEHYHSSPTGESESLAACFVGMADSDAFIFSLLHGQYGEDGRLAALAEQTGVRGSFGNYLACGLAMSKVHLGTYVDGLDIGLRIPRTRWLDSESDAGPVFEELEGATLVVKPNSLGSSVFAEVITAEAGSRQAFLDLIGQILRFDRRALVQEFVEGVEYSCGCLRQRESVLVLPVLRVWPHGGQFFGHRQKHVASIGRKEEFVDAAEPEAAQIQAVSRRVFQEVGFEQMCRFDYIVTRSGETYFLEANPIPGLMERSFYTSMLREAGLGVDDLILQTIENQRAKRQLQTTYRYEIV